MSEAEVEVLFHEVDVDGGNGRFMLEAEVEVLLHEVDVDDGNGISYRAIFRHANLFFDNGAHLKKMFGVFRVKNHDFTPKNHIFSNFRGGARRVRPPRILPCI
jgi:hypothetical protein